MKIINSVALTLSMVSLMTSIGAQSPILSHSALSAAPKSDPVTPKPATNDDPVADVFNVIKGFIFGFLGDDGLELKTCTFDSQNVTKTFWDSINTF